MTKSTITRERLEQLADNNTICKVSWDERIELAQIALAAMDSEPVAWTDEEELRDANESGSGYLFGIGHDANKFADPRRQIMLYRHAQPAQVVPEEATPDSIEILASGRCRDHVVYQWDKDQRNAAADSWNACRAAMLNGGKP